MTQSNDSPLREALPSLEEVFSSSPLERTPEELQIIVDNLRKMRATWREEETAGKKRPSKPTKLAAVPTRTLSADDLDLDFS